ncbi:MAG: SRPBCC family protein [Hyphomicrobiaceae bacterium]
MPDQSDAFAAPQGDAPDFVYTIYIAADAETVWNGLIDKELTEKYWGRHNVSDWQVGAKWEHIRADGSGIVDIHGHVVEIDPPNKLVVTWNGPEDSKIREPHPSLVTYELVALGPDTKLTVTHAKLNDGSDMHQGVTQGWIALMSNLKTLLETGRTLSDDKWG